MATSSRKSKLATAEQARSQAQALTQRLEALEAITTVILRRSNLEDLIVHLVDCLGTILRVDNVAILRLDEQQGILTMDTVRGPEEAVAARIHIPLGQGVAGTIAATRQPRIIEDLSTVDTVNTFLHEHLRSLAGVPLIVDDRVLGVLHVSTIEPRIFTQDEFALLQLVADRVALALDQRQSLQMEQHARTHAERVSQRLQAIESISDVLLSHLPVNELVSELLERVSKVMHVDNVAILLPTGKDEELTLYNVHGPEREVAASVRVPIGQGVAGRIMASRQVLIVPDLSKSDAINPFLHTHLRSLLGVPLLVEDRVIGVLHISTINNRQFDEDDVQLLQRVGDRIALALDRANAFAAMEQARREAEERSQQLEIANQQMDVFIGIASHELRTPLTTMTANIDLIARRLSHLVGKTEGTEPDPLLAPLPSLVARVQRQSWRLNRLVSDLLDASRLQVGHVVLKRTFQDLRPVVRSAVEEQQQLAPQRQIVVALPESTVSVDIDEERVGQVITNYLTNALKFSPAGQPVHVQVELQPLHVRVRVIDQGPGIPLSEQARIWERFQRIEGIRHQSGSTVGLGLGLFICKNVVEQHQGWSGVISEPGHGAAFWFLLPLAKEHHTPS